MSSEGAEQQEKWHVGKEIPIMIIFAMFMQTVGFVWWLASFQATVITKLDDQSYQMAALNTNAYSKSDAAKDGALYLQKIDANTERIKTLERKK